MKKKQRSATQTAIRLDDELLEDIDKIATSLSQPKLNPITRSEVIRRFVMEGVEREKKKR